MAKKAFLVTFSVTTRVVADVTGDTEKDEIAIIAAACAHADFSDIADNVTEIKEDTEMPYGTHYEDN